MVRKLAACVGVLLLLVACSGPQPVRQYEIGKVAAESILYEARVLHNKGVIPPAKFDEVRRVYDQLRAAQDIAIDARIAFIQADTPDAAKKVQVATAAVLSLSTKLLSLAQSMGIKGVQ